MQSRWCVKYGLIGLLCVLSVGTGRAEYMQGGAVRHYIGLTASGAYNTSFYQPKQVKAEAGAGGGLTLQYEMDIQGWLVGLGVGASYQLRRDTVPDFVDAFSRRDRDNDPVSYQYVYRSYRQRTDEIDLCVPVWFGRRFGDYFFLTAGAQLRVPMLTVYNVNTLLLTQGDYQANIVPVRSDEVNDFSSYGYYPEAPYAYAYIYKEYMRVGASLEVGSYIPLPSWKTRLRVSAYGTYDFRLGKQELEGLANYDMVDASWQTQSAANLRNNIRWNAINMTNLVEKLPQGLEIGVRLTVLFDVTHEKKWCVICED